MRSRHSASSAGGLHHIFPPRQRSHKPGYLRVSRIELDNIIRKEAVARTIRCMETHGLLAKLR